MRWPRRRRPQEPHAGTSCVCEPQWPALECEFNGYTLPVVASDGWSVVSVSGALGDARCTQCHAVYPDKWIIKPGTPPPFDWARETDQ